MSPRRATSSTARRTAAEGSRPGGAPASRTGAGAIEDDLPFPVPIGAILGLARLTEHALDEVSLTLPQYRLLGFCAIGPRTPSEVATWLGVRKQSVTRQLDALVRTGLLERTVDAEDRRRVLHGATPAGWAVLDRGQAALDDYLDLVLATVEESDRDLVHAGLAAAGRALNRAWHLTAAADEDPATALRRA
jgi:DNA-binding MarR family transcriptional regulator